MAEWTPQDLDERLAALLDPLREERDLIDRELAALATREKELKEARRRIEQVIKRAAGEPLITPKRKTRDLATITHPKPENMEKVREAIISLGDVDFTATMVGNKLKENGSGIGKDVVFRAVPILHDNGELRHVAKTRGGGDLWHYLGAK